MENKQLFEKQGNNYNPFFPIVRLEDIIDKISDKSIQWILNTYNHIYVEYSESTAITRNKVPALLRRTGLWITYNANKEIITEYYKGDNKDVQNYLQWTMDDNWERFDKIKHLDGSIEYQHLSEALKELMRNGNTITNFPDDEDLETRKGVLKFKDKKYDTDNFSGLGRVILRKNLKIIDNEVKNVLTQSMINKSNTIYIIQYDYDLQGTEIAIPEDCVLDFQGGSLSSGTINIGNSIIEAGQYKIFDNILFAKVAEHIEGNPIWFGAVGDGATDDTAAVQRCVDSFKTTVLNGDTFSISSVWVEEVGHTVGRSIINRAKIISKGDGIALNHHCKFEGGRIFVLANSIGITIGREDDREDHNRMSVKDVLIISTGENRNKNNYGIKCVAKSEGTHYNAFCTFSGVKIYGCEHGFYGNIRSSYINVELEGCYENFNGTNCSLNTIIIDGNASDTSEDYPYFINIKGNLNTIIPNVYDVGASGFQKSLINVDGYKNNILNSSQTIFNSDVTNTFSNPYYVNGLLHIKNPTYSVVFNNVEERDDIKKDVFDEKHNINATLWLIDSSKEGYIEFQFGRVFGFVGAEFLHKFSNDVFPKVEVRRNSTDEAPFLSITNKGYAPYTSIYSNTYKDFYNYNASYVPQWNENLSIRCYVKNGSNVLGAKFYAQQASSYTPVGLLGDAPSNMKNGEQYFATDIKEDKHSEGTMLMFKGGKMFDANGFGINKIKKVFEKFHSAVGKYQFVKIVMDCQNPFNTYIPIQFFNAGETIKFFYTQFVIGVYGSPSNLKFTVSKVSTDSETLKCYLYSKVVNGKLNLIIAFDKISGYYSHLSIDRVITNQSSYEMYTISENEDTSDYTESVFYLFEKYMTQGTRAGYVASNGECIFDRTLNMPLWWDGSKWVKYNGLDVSVNSTGPFNYKPSSSLIKTGFAYFCTDRSTQEGGENGIMIYHKGNDVWVDALGRVIE